MFQVKKCVSYYFQVRELVGLAELYYAGSHGMDIMFPVEDTWSIDHLSCIRSTDKQVLQFKIS